MKADPILTPNQRQDVAEALLLRSPKTVAKLLRTDVQHIKRLLADPETQADLRMARRRLIFRGVNKLVVGMSKVPNMLLKWAEDDKLAMSIRLECCKLLLENCRLYLHDTEWTERVEDIERQLREGAA